jgi:hypothetical protein
MRMVAVLIALLLSVMIVVVFSSAGLIFPGWKAFSDRAIWILVFMFLIGAIMNAISPSRIERIWSPVALGQCLCCAFIALE